MIEELESRISIRKFRVEDLNEVININLRCLPEHYPSSFYLSLYENCPEAFLVAEREGGGVVGYIMCRVEEGFFGKLLGRGERRGHVISIAVLPEYRRRGIGTRLLKSALKALREVYGCKECYLEVRVSNKEAINLYKKAGFRLEGRMTSYYRDGEDAYLMTIDLSGDIR